MTRPEFVQTLATMEAFFEKELSVEQANDWFEELKIYDIDRFRKAVKEAKRSCKFLPKLVEILNFISEVKIEVAQREYVECKKCNSTGIIPYTKMIKISESQELPYTYVCRCDCPNGDFYKYDGTKIKDTAHASKYYVPCVTEVGL